MLSMGMCTTRDWQTSGQLVQEVNVCTVGLSCSLILHSGAIVLGAFFFRHYKTVGDDFTAVFQKDITIPSLL